MFDTLLNILRDNAGLLKGAAYVSLQLNVWALLLAFTLGPALGVARLYSPKPIGVVIRAAIDVVRSIPLFVTMVWCFFAFPILLNDPEFSPLIAGIIALGVHSCVYIAETIRGGLVSVRPGQTEAARALGMSPSQVVRRVVLPQALIRVIPTLGFYVAITIKDSVLASVIAVPELLYTTDVLVGETGEPLALYTGLLVFYFVITYCLGRFIEIGYRRVSMRGSS